MENTCRTCLREKRLNQMKLLSTKWNNSSLSFADMLIQIVDVKSEFTNDEILLRICSTCELDLITAYNFKTVCQNTEKILFERYKEKIVSSQIHELKCEVIEEKSLSNEIEIHNNTDENIEFLYEEEMADVYEDDMEMINSDDNEEKPKIEIEIENKSISNDHEKKVIKKKAINKDVKKESTNGETIEKDISCNNAEKLPDCSPSKIKKRTRKTKAKPKLKVNPGEKRRNKKPSVYCKKCDIRFEKPRDYGRHCEETHLETFPCTICGKLYLQNRIKTHMITHLTEKNYNCSICDGKYASNSKLKEHMRMHTGEKRYKCKFCDEAFIYWTSRKNHVIKEHTKEKKYECYLCHRLFALRGTMVMHIKFHLGDFNYPCSICDKSFINSYAVKRHEKTHSKKGRGRPSAKLDADKNIESLNGNELVVETVETLCETNY